MAAPSSRRPSSPSRRAEAEATPMTPTRSVSGAAPLMRAGGDDDDDDDGGDAAAAGELCLAVGAAAVVGLQAAAAPATKSSAVALANEPVKQAKAAMCAVNVSFSAVFQGKAMIDHAQRLKEAAEERSAAEAETKADQAPRAFDVGAATLFFARAGLLINSGVVDCSSPKLKETGREGEALCSVEVTSIIGAFAFVALPLSYAVAHCGEMLAGTSDALCAAAIIAGPCCAGRTMWPQTRKGLCCVGILCLWIGLLLGLLAAPPYFGLLAAELPRLRADGGGGGAGNQTAAASRQAFRDCSSLGNQTCLMSCEVSLPWARTFKNFTNFWKLSLDFWGASAPAPGRPRQRQYQRPHSELVEDRRLDCACWREPNTTEPRRIPRIVHSVFLCGWLNSSECAKRRVDNSWRSKCQALNPGWEFRLWNDTAMEALIAERWPDKLSVFRGYPRVVQQADASRLLVLHEFGGVYFDLDFECVKPLDQLPDAGLLLEGIMERASNAWIAAEPRHPFLTKYLVPALWDVAPQACEGILKPTEGDRQKRPRCKVGSWATGPMFISKVWTDYLRDMGFGAHGAFRLFPDVIHDHRAGSNRTPECVLMKHKGKQSWGKN